MTRFLWVKHGRDVSGNIYIYGTLIQKDFQMCFVVSVENHNLTLVQIVQDSRIP